MKNWKSKEKKSLREVFSFNICGEQRLDLQHKQSVAASTGGAAVAWTQPWLFQLQTMPVLTYRPCRSQKEKPQAQTALCPQLDAL